VRHAAVAPTIVMGGMVLSGQRLRRYQSRENLFVISRFQVFPVLFPCNFQVVFSKHFVWFSCFGLGAVAPNRFIVNTVRPAAITFLVNVVCGQFVQPRFRVLLVVR
jgi:hypothetical protein